MRVPSALLALGFLITSCGGDLPKAKIAPTYSEPPERVAPTMRVLAPGYEPREKVRYTIDPADWERISLDLAMGGTMQIGDQVGQSFGPPVRITVTMGPSQQLPDGRLRHSIAITNVQVADMGEKMDPRVIEQTQAQFAPLLLVKGWSDMDDRGIVWRSELQALDQVSPRLRTMLSNIRTALISIPFPEEPIGLMARWQVERRFSVSGVLLNQTVTYTLSQRQGNQLRLQVTGRQTAPPQAMDGGRLEAYETQVVGSAIVRLDKFAPLAEAQATNTMRSLVPVQGQVQPVQTNTRTEVRAFPSEMAE